jgi:hypothetical protein
MPFRRKRVCVCAHAPAQVDRMLLELGRVPQLQDRVDFLLFSTQMEATRDDLLRRASAITAASEQVQAHIFARGPHSLRAW